MRNSFNLRLELSERKRYDHTINGNQISETEVCGPAGQSSAHPHSCEAEDYFEGHVKIRQDTAYQEEYEQQQLYNSTQQSSHSSSEAPLTARMVDKNPRTAILVTCSKESEGESHSYQRRSDATRIVPSGAVSPMGAGPVASGYPSAHSTHLLIPPSCSKTEDLQTQPSPLTLDDSPDCRFSESDPYTPKRALKAIRHGLGLFKKTQAHPTTIAERNIVSVLLRGRAGLIVEDGTLNVKYGTYPPTPSVESTDSQFARDSFSWGSRS
jgi:hypothetical protein